MPDGVASCVLLSDFNLGNLAGLLANDPTMPRVEVRTPPFGQMMAALLDEGHDCWSPRPDALVVWTQPQSALESFRAVLELDAPPIDRLEEEVDRYCDGVRSASGRARMVLVPTWVVPAYHRGWGLLDLEPQGVAATLWRLNLRLADNLRDLGNVFVLNAQSWIEAGGPASFNPKFWYMGKIPFGPGVFKEAVGDVKTALAALAGRSKKLLILDLDDTLWGGIVGEVGGEGLRLGGHDPIGEAFVDFQRAVKSLQNRGIVLGIASKNTESVALEAMSKHPEMVLRPDDFAGWRINWQDKAANITDLVAELNLGLESAVFIDDNPAERGRVAEALPEVLVPDWPDDRMLYKQALLSLRCFDGLTTSGEDKSRARMYGSERARQGERASAGSVIDWLRTLGLTVQVEPLSSANLVRVTQLLNKTNQMNLSTRRMTHPELASWADRDDHGAWALRVADRFGDYGLTGIVSVEVNESSVRIVDFVLSCRVFGRRIEDVMVHTAVQHARSIGVDRVEAVYLPTAKNGPCLEFWQNAEFDVQPDGRTFIRETGREYPLPDFVEVNACNAAVV